MSETFDCPNCGAPLDVPPGSDFTMRCPFCSSSVMIPAELRARGTHRDSFTESRADSVKEIILLARSGDCEQAVQGMMKTFGISRHQAETSVEAMVGGQIFELENTPVMVSHSAQTVSAIIDTMSKTGMISPDLLTSASPQARRKTQAIAWISSLSILIGICAFLFVLLQPGAPLETLGARLNVFGPVRLVSSFGQSGSLPGQLTEPEQIAVDLQGNIFAADFSTGRISMFSPTGEFLRLWDVSDEEIVINALDVDQNGILYAAAEDFIWRFDTKNNLELQPFTSIENEWFEDFLVLPGGGFAAVIDNETLQRLDENGSVIWQVEDAFYTIAGDTDSTCSLAVDGENNLYMAGQFVHSILKFSPDGRYLNRFGTEGEGKGQLEFMQKIAVDGKARIFVNDWGRLEIFSADGQFLSQAGLPQQVYDFQFSSDGRMYVISRTGKIYIYQVR